MSRCRTEKRNNKRRFLAAECHLGGLDEMNQLFVSFPSQGTQAQAGKNVDEYVVSFKLPLSLATGQYSHRTIDALLILFE